MFWHITVDGNTHSTGCAKTNDHNVFEAHLLTVQSFSAYDIGSSRLSLASSTI